MNNPTSLFTRTAGLIALFVLAIFSHQTVNAQVAASRSMQPTKLQAQRVQNNTWCFEGLKMSPADEKAFVSLLRQVDPTAYSVKEVSDGKIIRTYGKASPSQIQLVRKTLEDQTGAQKNGGIYRHKTWSDDKFSENTLVFLSGNVNTDVVNKIDALMTKYRGPNVVSIKNMKQDRSSLQRN